MGISNMDKKAVDSTKQKKKVKKKRAASELDLAGITDVTGVLGHTEVKDGLHVNDDSSEPTMGEKLANLNIVDNGENPEKEESALATKPPSADSVHVLLKQALHADDRELLLKCLFTQDEKVITNSTSLLSPSDVLKLLGSLISILQSRGTVVACALPWLRSLLLQHASCIISQESSLLALNSLYQLIDSRISTFRPTLQLSNCMDFLFSGITDGEADEIIAPVIYEDKDDDSDEYESESESEDEDDAMENDQETVEQQPEDAFNGFSDFEGSDDGMSD